MNILVVGCGDVGLSLIQRLEKLGHQVSVVEENEDALSKLYELSPPFQGMSLHGVPIDTDVLKSAGIEDCDAVAAVEHDDNVNIMVAQLAHNVFKIDNVFARIIDPSTQKMFANGFGFKTICDTDLATEALMIGLGPEESFSDKRIMLGQTTTFFSYVDAKASDVGKALSKIEPPRPTQMTFGIIHKNGTLQLATKDDNIVQEGDKIIFAGIAD